MAVDNEVDDEIPSFGDHVQVKQDSPPLVHAVTRRSVTSKAAPQRGANPRPAAREEPAVAQKEE